MSRGFKGTLFHSPLTTGETRGFHAVTMGFALRNVGDISSLCERWHGWPAREAGSSASRSPVPTTPFCRGLQHPLLPYRPRPRAHGGAALAKGESVAPPPPVYVPPLLPRPLAAVRRDRRMMKEAGLADAKRIPLTGGIVSLYVGVKA